MANDTYEPALAHLQAAVWSWSAARDPTSEVYATLLAWCQTIDAIGDDIDVVWQSRSILTAQQADLIAQYGYVYGLTQEQLPPTVGQLQEYILALVNEDGTVGSLINELMALIGAGSISAGPVTNFPGAGGLTFPANGSGIILWQFSSTPIPGLTLPLQFPILPLLGSNPTQAEAQDGTTAATVVGTGAGLLPITFATNPFITVIQAYPTFVVQVQSYLAFDRGAFARAVARFQPAHLLPGTVQEINTL